MHKISFKAFHGDLGAEMMILGRNCFIFSRLCDLYFSVERHDGKQPCDLWNVEEFFTVYRRLQDQSSIPILLTCHFPASVSKRGYVWNQSCGNEFRLEVHFHFQMKRLQRRLTSFETEAQGTYSVTSRTNCASNIEKWFRKNKCCQELMALTLNFQKKSSHAVAHSRRREQPFEK